MADPRLNKLPNLGWFDSKRWLPTHIVAGLAQGAWSTIGVTLTIESGKPVAKLGPAIRGTSGSQKLRSFDEAKDSAFMLTLNRQLAGEKDYPMVGKILGTVVGKLGIDFASVLYSTANSVLGRAEKSLHVFVRDKDEIWRTEAIGKFGQPGQAVPTYIMTYLLIDPFRSGDPRSAWILHEQQYPLVG